MPNPNNTTQPMEELDEIFKELWAEFYENSDISTRQGDIFYNAIDTAKHATIKLIALQETKARIDENRIAYEWDRSKGLQYFEDRLKKRQHTLTSQLNSNTDKELK